MPFEKYNRYTLSSTIGIDGNCDSRETVIGHPFEAERGRGARGRSKKEGITRHLREVEQKLIACVQESIQAPVPTIAPPVVVVVAIFPPFRCPEDDDVTLRR